jgi:hypothetical protein
MRNLFVWKLVVNQSGRRKMKKIRRRKMTRRSGKRKWRQRKKSFLKSQVVNRGWTLMR